jgi:lipopolysaccharide transport system permease protein
VTQLELDGGAATAGEVVADFTSHLPVLRVLARSDFQVRYKRASFGVLWAVVVPLVQAAILAVVFGEVLKLGSGREYAVFVMSGVTAWSYFSGTVAVGATAIVDGSGLTDKVWFPRALLPVVPAVSGLVSLAVTLAALLVAVPLFGVGFHLRLLLLVPACLLLIAFTVAFSLCLAALHVYFRDVRFLVQAGLLVLFYLTPIVYPLSRLGQVRPLVEANPVSGIVALFHVATVGARGEATLVPVLVSAGATLVLAVAAVEAYRRHDRLFVDLL